MNSPNLEEQQLGAATVSPPEIQYVPLWVKGIVAAGVILFAIQLPDFKRSLMDATIKSRASISDEAGRYTDAIKLYAELRSRYPSDKGLIKKLAFSQYHAGQNFSALETFDLLVGVKMPKREVDEINTAISDIASKLKLNNK